MSDHRRLKPGASTDGFRCIPAWLARRKSRGLGEGDTGHKHARTMSLLLKDSRMPRARMSAIPPLAMSSPHVTSPLGCVYVCGGGRAAVSVRREGPQPSTDLST